MYRLKIHYVSALQTQGYAFIRLSTLLGVGKTWFSLYHLCVSRANSEIAQVRTKSKQEQAVYQASLRKEQMKVDSLERTLEQKVSQTSSITESWGVKGMWNHKKIYPTVLQNKEIEELTKICDELIAKMGKS